VERPELDGPALGESDGHDPAPRLRRGVEGDDLGGHRGVLT
jgi:hypothetical protein